VKEGGDGRWREALRRALRERSEDLDFLRDYDRGVRSGSDRRC